MTLDTGRLGVLTRRGSRSRLARLREEADYSATHKYLSKNDK